MNYTITKDSGVPAYIQLYNYLVQDIVAGIYPLDSRLPSKRIIAEETGVSLITVEHTMNLLSDEGYIETRQRSGYFVIYREADFQVIPEIRREELPVTHPQAHQTGEFPFSVLARTMRKVLLDYEEQILVKSPNHGCDELRTEICSYLGRSRGIHGRLLSVPVRNICMDWWRSFSARDASLESRILLMKKSVRFMNPWVLCVTR